MQGLNFVFHELLKLKSTNVLLSRLTHNVIKLGCFCLTFLRCCLGARHLSRLVRQPTPKIETLIYPSLEPYKL